MRNVVAFAILLTLSALSLSPAPANAQAAPFSMREQPEETAPPSPQPQTTREADAVSPTDASAAGVPSEGSRTVEAAADGSPRQGPTQPQALQAGARVPFDVDGDGRAEPYVLPSDERPPSRPATTVSPLGGEAPLADVLPIDAVDRAGRSQLAQLLRNAPPRVRELRVNVAGATGFAEALVDRPIIPQRVLELDGEVGSATLPFYLGAAEASRDATLSVAFTNSVLVLPEASRLRVSLNGRQIAQTAVDSPERTKVIALPIPADLLRTGENTIRLEAQMHHRIDCSVAATFELWSAFDARLTGLTFAGSRVLLSGLSDLPAVGVSATGTTRLNVVQASPLETGSVTNLIRTVQTIALRGEFAQPHVMVGDALADPSPGLVNIVLGTAGELRRVVPSLASFATEADVGPFVRLVDTPASGPTVIVSGPDQRSVETAIARLAAPLLSLPGGIEGPTVPNGSDKTVGPGETISLREAGLSTLSFAGRRFSTAFNVRLPADFYASAYGEARLLLDAAYARDVEPGSILVVRVNGVIANTVRFDSLEGDVFDDHPVVLVMENFRAGDNTVEIIAELDTKSDRSCLPGGTVPFADRFVLFSSTKIAFANYAKVGQVPNLGAFAADASPYERLSQPLPVVVAGATRDSVAGAGTLLARLALASGLPLDVAVADDPAAHQNGPLLIVGAIDALSDDVLEATALDLAAPQSWGEAFPAGTAAEPQGLERYDDVLQRLRRQLERNGQGPAPAPLGGGPADALFETGGENVADARVGSEDARWLERLREERTGGTMLSNLLGGIRNAISLDISLNGDGDGARNVRAAVPENATLVIAQAPAPANNRAAWTVVTAPDATLLSRSMEAMLQPAAWGALDGRLASYSLQDDTVNVVQPQDVIYVATIPFSLTNWRLIAANWLSLNSAYYTLALLIAAALLGLSTFALLRSARGPR